MPNGSQPVFEESQSMPFNERRRKVRGGNTQCLRLNLHYARTHKNKQMEKAEEQRKGGRMWRENEVMLQYEEGCSTLSPRPRCIK